MAKSADLQVGEKVTARTVMTASAMWAPSGFYSSFSLLLDSKLSYLRLGKTFISCIVIIVRRQAKYFSWFVHRYLCLLVAYCMHEYVDLYKELQLNEIAFRAKYSINPNIIIFGEIDSIAYFESYEDYSENPGIKFKLDDNSSYSITALFT